MNTPFIFDYPLWLQMLLGLSILSLLFLIVLLSVVFLGKLLNKGAWIEGEQHFSEQDYLQGILQSDLSQGMTGELLLKGAFGGRDVKPCRLYSENDDLLVKGTPVVVVTVSSGIAYVIKQTTIF